MIRKRQILVALLVLAFYGVAWAVEVNEPNLIAHWKLDEGSGSIAYDSAGDNDGIIYGATWTSGWIGDALDFDGSGDYVEIGNEANFDFGSDTDFTICAWIKTTATLDRRRIVNKGEDGHSPYTGYGLYMDPPGIVHFRLKDNADVVIVETITSVNDGSWHFVAGVADRDGNLQIYHNGILEDSDSLALVDNINTDIPVAIGRCMDYDGQYFDGKIDDIRIYDRALSAEEIEQLYQEGLSAYEQAVINIERAIDEKQEALTKIDAAIEKEEKAYNTLEELLESEDYGDLSKWYISKAKRNIHSAIQHEERYTNFLEKSIKKLECSLTALSWEPNLIAHWKLDEGSGSIAYDSAGDNDGTIYGATWTSGKIDGALDFSGVSDCVNVRNDDSLNPSQITVSLWFNANDNTRSIITKGTSRGWYYERDWDIFGTGTEIQWLGSSGSCNIWRIEGTPYPSLGEWHHVVGTWNGTTDPNGAKLYLDGYLVNSTTASGTTLATSHNVYIGGYRLTGSYEFNGKIDDVRVYNRALSDDEILQLYQEGL